jgi:pilus assembly protein CpaF
LVSESIDLVVHLARRGGELKATEIVAVEDLQGGFEAATFTVTDLVRRPHWQQPLQWTGQLPVRAAGAFAIAGYDVRELLAAVGPSTAGAVR